MKTARGSQEQVNYNNRIKDQAKQANRDKEQKTPTQLCSWCLNNHQQPHQQHCPAYNKKCNNCSILGHFARACSRNKGRKQYKREQQTNQIQEESAEDLFATEHSELESQIRKDQETNFLQI